MRSLGFALVFILGSASLTGQRRLDLSVLLDSYTAGNIDAVIATVKQTSLTEIHALRNRWKDDGEKWIKRGDKSARRPFVAAALALLASGSLAVVDI